MKRRSFLGGLLSAPTALIIPYEPQVIYSFSSFDREEYVAIFDNELFSEVLGRSYIQDRAKITFEAFSHEWSAFYGRGRTPFTPKEAVNLVLSLRSGHGFPNAAIAARFFSIDKNVGVINGNRLL